ncbi:MAG: lysostaphin resistance A-like protein [Blastocatellales bacterium]
MSSITTYCPTCGDALDSASGQSCPRCSPQTSVTAPPPEDKLWGVGTGLLTWFISVALILGFQFVAVLIYLAIRFKQTGQVQQVFEIDWLVAVLSVISTFPAHILTLVVCWFAVTKNGRRQFWQTLGWGWHSQFKWVHAVGLAFLMMGVGFVLEKLLPHKETDLEKLLKMGAAIRISVAALAVLTAPLVEEVVYRGVLYSGVERVWGKAAGIAVVAFLFALVHVPQYWGSYAAITTIVSLSLVLTGLRAWTGKLLPCVATHLIYNGVQAIFLLLAPENLPDSAPQESAAAIAVIVHWLGLT